MNDLPHITERIVNSDGTASYEMRGWMERDWVESNVSGSYTAKNYDEVNATSSATITLPFFGKVKVNNIDGSIISVNLQGDQKIFGDTSVQIHSYGSVIFKYLPKLNQWVFE